MNHLATHIKQIALLLLLSLAASGILMAQTAPGGVGGTGTVANPFTSIGAARNVTVAGTYNFNISGNAFTTHVDANGWVLVVSGGGAATGAYPQVTALALQSNNALNLTIMAALDVNELRMNVTAGGTLDVTTSDATSINRLNSYTSLGWAPNHNTVWAGTNVAGLQASCNGGALPLNQKIWHSCGIGGNLHWIPNSNFNGWTAGANNLDINLWVRNENDLALWLRADAGVTGTTAVSNWNDQSGNTRNADMSFGDPELIIGDLNFNPILDFDGDDYFRFTSSPFVTGYTEAETFTVLNEDSGTINSGHPYDFGGSNRAFHYTWGNLHVYEGSFTNERLGFRPDNGNIADAKAGVSSIVGDPVFTSDWNIYGTHSATNDWGIQFNGQFKATSTTNTTNFSLSAGNEYVGAVGGTGLSVFRGKIGEVILYNRVLTVVERQQVNSYMALKYGITLNQSTAQDYLASDGSTTMWVNDADGFNADIFGIGRDDGSALLQQVSRSVNTDGLLTLSLDDDYTAANLDAGRTTGIATDLNFMIVANNGGNLDWAGTNKCGCPGEQFMSRIWKVDKTGAAIGAAWIAINNADLGSGAFASLGTPSNMEGLYLLVDDDGDFTSGFSYYEMTLDGNGYWKIQQSLTDGQYFTFAYSDPLLQMRHGKRFLFDREQLPYNNN